MEILVIFESSEVTINICNQIQPQIVRSAYLYNTESLPCCDSLCRNHSDDQLLTEFTTAQLTVTGKSGQEEEQDK
jgi:hypothetical protein